MKKLIILTTLLASACADGPKLTRFRIENVAKDTVFYLERSRGNKRPRILMSAVGYLDSTVSVFLINPRQPERLYWLTFPLPKGPIDSLRRDWDFYDDQIEIHYKHEKATEGSLTLTADF